MELMRKQLGQTPDKQALRQLYHSAFPKYEQMPWYIMRLVSLRKDIDIAGYYAGEKRIGFTFHVATDQVLFILFLAVDEACRGQGFGSAILTKLKEDYPGRAIVLNVELLDPEADNYPQRLRRMEFYRKNGFFDTGYDVDEVGGTFRVLATTRQLDQRAYLGAFAKLSFGCWKPYIRKGKDYGQRTDT